METNLKENILVVNHMKKYFPTKKKGLFVKAIDDISFTVRKNEVVGLVGESGSGKSTTAYSIIGLHGIQKVMFVSLEKIFPCRQRSDLWS